MCHFKTSQVTDLLIILITFVELQTIEDDEVVGISTAHSFVSWKSEVCVIKLRDGILKFVVDCTSPIKVPSVTTSDSSLDMQDVSMLIAFNNTFFTVVFFKPNNEESDCLKMGEFLAGRKFLEYGDFYGCSNVYKVTANKYFQF